MEPPRARAVVLRWAPAVAYAGLLWWLSARPALEIPAGLSDKLIHAAAYVLLGALVWRAAAGRLLGLPSKRAVVLAVALCASYAAVDEVHQAFVPGRVASLGDVAADLGGSLAAILVLGLAGRLRPAAASGADSGHSTPRTPSRREVSGGARDRRRAGER